MLLIATAAVLTVSLTGCEAKVYGAPAAPTPGANVPAPPESPHGVPGAAFDGLPARISRATEDAAVNGATISTAVLDRANNHILSNGNDQLIAIASVAKLFIADELLSQESSSDGELSSADSQALDRATGADGYPQRFGIPDGLYAEPVAVKQGWMCCIGDSWMHLSTGIIGSDRRYVMVVESLQPSDDATARATITQAVKTMFPSGRI
jgi:hypothetical protein